MGQHYWLIWLISKARLGGASSLALLCALICFLDSLVAGWVGELMSVLTNVTLVVDNFLSFLLTPVDRGGKLSYKSKVGLTEDVSFLTLSWSGK